MVVYLDCDVDLKARLVDGWPQITPKHWHLENGFTIVAMDRDEIVGFISCYPKALRPPLEDSEEGFIDAIEVTPSRRNQGIATELICRSSERLKESYDVIQISGWSSEDKIEAIHLWKKLGFGLCPTQTISGMTGESIKGYKFARSLLA
ncbi:MAG: GNAT family N-acetyltransferase [Opitutales bacterium]|nr:GNAT family N-acetyltransferase [Opitutales bacterium]NRA25663.1 GNAT family N-acetyltransferase [Opitutales bacterium]